MPFEKISADADLNAIASEDLTLRNYYHVRLGLVDDFGLLSPQAQERLRHNADVVCLILMWLRLENLFPPIVGIENVHGFLPENDRARYCKILQEELLLDRSVLPGVFGSNYISRYDWMILIGEMNKERIRTETKYIRQFNTVMSLTIQSHKETDLADR